MHQTRVFRVDQHGQEVEYVTLLASSPDEASLKDLEDLDSARGDPEGPPASDRSADASPVRARLGVERYRGAPPARMEAPTALRRKLAWAVGSFYGVSYSSYRSWPAEYARKAAARLVEIHGGPKK